MVWWGGYGEMKRWLLSVPRLSVVAWLCTFLFGLGVIGTEWTIYAVRRFGADPNAVVLRDAFLAGCAPAFVFAIVLMPIVEELIFRGFLLRMLLVSTPVVFALGMDALVFALFHPSFPMLPMAFVLGLIFAAVVLRFGSLPLTIVGHAFWNGHSALLVALGLRVPGYALRDVGEHASRGQPGWWLVMGAVTMIAGAVGLARQSPAGPAALTCRGGRDLASS